MREIPDSLRHHVIPFRDYLSAVNPVKLQLISCLGEGKSNIEIAKKLHLTEWTIKKYISEILMETELKNRTQIALLYLIVDDITDDESRK
jgi:DNA-binding NarL/FixJ family response regulator